MAETSLFWTDATGDGGSYNQTQLALWLEYLFTTDQAATEGVLEGAANELAVSGASSPVAVATGAALVKGHWYRNSAAVNVAVASPAVSTRIDRVVLQADWAAQTVRIALVAGVEGGAAPALTQTDGTKWEISLAQVSITTGGVITLTDERAFCHFGTRVNAAMLDAGALSADATGRAVMATDYFNAATVLLKIADDAFAADVATRRLFEDGIWQAAQLANNCLSADATGRAKIQDGYFDAATVLAKVANEAITAAKITNRWRHVLVSADGGYYGVSETACKRGLYGLVLPDGQAGTAAAGFVVPRDYVSDLTVSPVVMSATTGNLQSAAVTIYHGTILEAFDTHSDAQAEDTVALTEYVWTWPWQLALTNLTIGDYVNLVFVRDGANVADTLGGNLFLLGWLITYTADS